MTYEDDEHGSLCPVCGDYIQYCQGHGEIGDPAGYAVMQKHDNGDHSECCIESCFYPDPPPWRVLEESKKGK